MKSRNESSITFGITLTSANRSKDAKTDPVRSVPAVRCINVIPGKAVQKSTNPIACPRRMVPPQSKPPFSADMFKYEPAAQPELQTKPVFREEQHIRAELERLRIRTGSPSYSRRSALTNESAVWKILKFIGTGVFLVVKYTAIAICLVITISCFFCAGRK